MEAHPGFVDRKTIVAGLFPPLSEGYGREMGQYVLPPFSPSKQAPREGAGDVAVTGHTGSFVRPLSADCAPGCIKLAPAWVVRGRIRERHARCQPRDVVRDSLIVSCSPLFSLAPPVPYPFYFTLSPSFCTCSAGFVISEHNATTGTGKTRRRWVLRVQNYASSCMHARLLFFFCQQRNSTSATTSSVPSGGS